MATIVKRDKITSRSNADLSKARVLGNISGHLCNLLLLILC